MHLSDRELATVLASLRYWQDEMARYDQSRSDYFQDVTPLTMVEKTQPLRQKFGNPRVDSATYCLVTFDGQMTCNPAPLAKVTLREHIKRLAFMLLGPPPESWDQFYRNADGTPGPQHAEKMDELARLTDQPKKPMKRKKK